MTYAATTVEHSTLIYDLEFVKGRTDNFSFFSTLSCLILTSSQPSHRLNEYTALLQYPFWLASPLAFTSKMEHMLKKAFKFLSCGLIVPSVCPWQRPHFAVSSSTAHRCSNKNYFLMCLKQGDHVIWQTSLRREGKLIHSRHSMCSAHDRQQLCNSINVTPQTLFSSRGYMPF
jgi:hypothetical protein